MQVVICSVTAPQVPPPLMPSNTRYVKMMSTACTFIVHVTTHRFWAFVNEDPLGFAGSEPNFYAYVGDDPINFSDPFGLKRGTFGIRGATTRMVGQL